MKIFIIFSLIPSILNILVCVFLFFKIGEHSIMQLPPQHIFLSATGSQESPSQTSSVRTNSPASQPLNPAQDDLP
jgi:hypothetical protein